MRQTEPTLTISATAMLIEKKTTTNQRLPDGEGVIGRRQQQHQKGLNLKRDLKKWSAEEEPEGLEARVGGGRSRQGSGRN